MTGKISEMQEIVLQGAGETARNSMSMTRAPGPLTDGVRGILILYYNIYCYELNTLLTEILMTLVVTFRTLHKRYQMYHIE